MTHGVDVVSIRSLLTQPGRAGLAYLDPGSGSFLLQLLLAGILGGAFIVRSQWTRIKGFVQRLFRRGQSPDEHGQ